MQKQIKGNWGCRATLQWRSGTMRGLMIIMCTLAILLAGCGGGGGGTLPPSTHDLAAVQGIWDCTSTLKGEISGPDGSIPVNMVVEIVFTITPNSVEDHTGNIFAWSYDGNRLRLQLVEEGTFIDADCGEIYISMQYDFSADMDAATTATSFSGTVDGSGSSQFCEGTLNLYAKYNGDLTKR